MKYINCGAKINGKDPKSKAELRRQLAEHPDHVTWYGTAMGQEGPLPYPPPVGTTYSVVGPNPYRDRRFYGSVSSNGKLK